MKKLLLTFFTLNLFCTLLKAQDTMFVHKIDTAKFIVVNDTIIAQNLSPDTLGIYFLNMLDSISFIKNQAGNFDTLNIKHSNKFTLDYHAFKPLRYSSKIPFGKIDSITFSKADTLDYKTVAGFNVLVNAAYRPAKYWYGKEDGMGMAEMGTDIWTAGAETYIATSGIALDNRPLILYQNLLSTNANILRQWRQLYSGVNLCNLGIKIANDNNFADPDERAVRKAELYFLRAFYYWHIVETWGGVHLTEAPYYTPNLKANQNPISTLVPGAKRASVSEFYALIISDLIRAIDVLPENASEYGRATKLAAKAFLARVYLSSGNNVSAKQTASDIIASSKFSILSKYVELWDMTKQKNSEVIWAIDYMKPTIESDVYNDLRNPYGYGLDIWSANGNSTSNRGNNNLHTVFTPGYDRANKYTGNIAILRRQVLYQQPFIRFKPTKFLLELFDETQDSRYNGSFQTVWKFNTSVESLRGTNKLKGKKGVINPFETDPSKWILYPFSERDTALVITKNAKTSPNYYTVDAFETYNADGSAKAQNVPENYLFPALLKFQDSIRSSGPDELGSGNIQSEKDVFVIRLAEMYLIAAEASLKAGNASEAANYVNALRIKRAVPGKENEMLVTANDITIDFILDERAREFAGEQIRWFDLKRTGKLIERVKKYNPDAGVNIQDYHVLRPIPSVQMEFTPGLIQNPGY